MGRASGWPKVQRDKRRGDDTNTDKERCRALCRGACRATTVDRRRTFNKRASEHFLYLFLVCKFFKLSDDKRTQQQQRHRCANVLNVANFKRSLYYSNGCCIFFSNVLAFSHFTFQLHFLFLILFLRPLPTLYVYKPHAEGGREQQLDVRAEHLHLLHCERLTSATHPVQHLEISHTPLKVVNKSLFLHRATCSKIPDLRDVCASCDNNKNKKT